MKVTLIALSILTYCYPLFAPTGVLPLGATLSKCYGEYVKLGKKWPLSKSETEAILRGDTPEPYPIAEDLGSNALSYLAMAEHLTGQQKAELWELFLNGIQSITRRRLTSREQSDIDDKTVRVFRGHKGELLVISLENGQVYRGYTEEGFLPADWSLKTELGRGSLRKLGNPSRPEKP